MIKIEKIFIDKDIPERYFKKAFLFQKRINAPLVVLKSREELYVKSERVDLGKRNIYLTLHQGKIFLKCPCSKNSVSCRYFVLDTMIGCPYDCSYCYLQVYQNIRAVTFYLNLEEKIKKLTQLLSKRKGPFRVGTGEFCDSLVLEDFLPQIDILYFYFKKLPHIILELKTKSDNINTLLNLKPTKNIIISWSLNPQKIVRKEEKLTVSLNKRLKSAFILQEKGWRIGFHFDPIIYSQNCKDMYFEVIKKLKKFYPQKIAWISLGILRFPPRTPQIIKKRFPDTKILNGEFILGNDNKYRYFRHIRREIYKFMLESLKIYFKNVPIYLCMETPLIWKEVYGFVPRFRNFFGI